MREPRPVPFRVIQPVDCIAVHAVLGGAPQLGDLVAIQLHALLRLLIQARFEDETETFLEH